MRRDAPTSKPAGNAPLRMATGHAIVNFCLADMLRGLRDGHGYSIDQAIWERRPCLLVSRHGFVPANWEWGMVA